MSSKKKIGCITSELYGAPKSETWNQIPVDLILLEPCPNCGGVPEVNVKRRKRAGDLYWVDCPTCEYTGPACDTERAARNWWNKNLTGRMDDSTWRRIDCVPTEVLKKLRDIAKKDDYDYELNWVLSELIVVLEARKKVPEAEKALENLSLHCKPAFRWMKQAELTSTLATLRKTATHVHPIVYDWMMRVLCKDFMKDDNK